MERPEQTKSSHEEVKYEAESKQKRETCSRCQHFIDEIPARCQTVASPIKASGWCERFELDPARLTHEEYRQWREKGEGKEPEHEPSTAAYRAWRESEDSGYDS